jgi:hypothetical protein
MEPHIMQKRIDQATIAARMHHAAEQLQLLERQTEALLSAWSVQAQVLTDMIDLQDRLFAGSAAAAPASRLPPSSGTPAWESRRTALILPDERVAAMWARAAQWHVHKGGRFQTVDSTLLLWSGTQHGETAPENRARIMAFAVAERQSPEPGLATIARLAWRPDLGGNAAMIWRALEVLAGEALVGLA